MAEKPTGLPPDPTDVRAALDRVLGSHTFGRANRSSDFLRFIVEETLAGRGDRLKGFAIAVEVFERDDDFDAQNDPLVRVEAGRLRRRLAQYYAEEGSSDPIRITLSRGGYVPSFRIAATASDAESSTRPPIEHARPDAHSAPGPTAAAAPAGVSDAAPTAPRHPWPLLAGAIGVAALAFVAVFDFLGTPTPTDDAPPTEVPREARSIGSTPRVLVLPVTGIADNGSADAFAGGLTEEILLWLVRFNIIAVASPTVPGAEAASLERLGTEFDARYVLAASVRLTGDEARVIARLVETQNGTQLWTGTFEEGIAGSDSLAAQQAIARNVAMLITSPFGPVFGHEAERVADKPAFDLDPFECLTRFYAYARVFDPALHADVVLCMQRAVLSAPEFAAAWSSLATLYLHEHVFGYDPQPDRGDALQRALEAARRALDIDGSDRVAAVSMTGVQLALGDRDGFERAVERALSLTPSHPAALATVGYLLTLAGERERGLPLIEAALPTTVNAPGWYYLSFSLGSLQAADYGAALDWALQADAPNWLATPLVVAATAAYAGRLELAQREVARLLELAPDFENGGRDILIRWGIDADLRETLIGGLRLAGLELS